jgi:hypothetical protein
MRQLRLKDTAAKFFGRVTDGVDRAHDAVHQLVHIEWAAVGEVAFGQRPHAFVGIEIGSVGRKVFNVQARMSPEELGERRAVVGGGVVEQNDDRTVEVAEQLAEKSAHFFLADVVEEKQIVQTQVLSLRTDGDSRDDRDFVPASLAMTLNGGRALRRPSPDHQGGQQEAGFIGKN